MALSRFVWRTRKAIFLVAAFLCVAGFYCYANLPVAIFPDLNAPRIILTADAGDAPVSTVVARVTRPLESAVAGIPGVTRLGSLSQRGGTELDINFDWGADMQSALQLVNAKLAQAQADLPPGTKVQAERLNPAVFPIMGYSLSSRTLSPEALRHAAQYTLRPRLLRVTGVQEITVMGGDTPDYIVAMDPTALAARGVSVNDVEEALSKSNAVSSVGYYNESYLQHDILVSGLFHGASDIEGVTVAVKGGVPVTVAQIATVRRSVEPRTVETSGNGRDAVLLDVIKQPAGNTLQIADGIQSALVSARAALPPGITISNYYDQSQIVRESQSSVLESILVGGALALLVLMLFLGNLRTAAVVLIILPLTIVITFGLMRLLGQTLNIMTLGAVAIALGLVIDDGIVVVENMFHELEQGRSRRAAIAAGVRAITPAMIGSSLTTMAAFLPLAFLRDLTGQFFGPLSLVMIATLAVSVILALLLTPLLADFLLPAGARAIAGARKTRLQRFLGFFPRQFDRIVRIYTRALTWSLAHRAVVIALLAPVAVAAYLIGTHLQTGFFPEFDEGGFILDYQLPVGTSLAESSRTAGQIETMLGRTPEIAAWSRRTGAQLGFDITTQNVGDMSVRLNERRSRNIDAVMDSVREQVESRFPQAQPDFHQILQDEIGDIAGSPSPVQIKIYGSDEPTLERLARQVDDTISKVQGVVDDNNGIVHSGPQTLIVVDTAKAQRFGLNADDIAHAAEAALQGSEPTVIQEGEELVGVRVMLNRPFQQIDAASLSDLPISTSVTSGGGLLRLSQVADILTEPGAAQVTRENQRQMIAVTAGLSGRDLGGATRDIQAAVAKAVQLPPGYSIEYGGEFASQQQSFAELETVLAVALLLVFTLLVFQFRSLRQAAALLVAAILSLSGVLLALLVTGTPLNISSYTGAIMIVGIITENGIVLFDFFNKLRAERPHAPLAEIMAQAGSQRLRPILMTTIAAILALFPLALGIGAGAALQKPLAVAVIGGLCVSIVFTLLVAPVLFIAMESRRPSTDAQAAEEQFDKMEAEPSP